MKKLIHTIASLLCICLVTAALLNVVSNVVSRKDSWIKNAEFFEEKNQHDILFFGSSHMLNAVFPMDLWGEFGYTAYSFAGHGSRAPTNYWIMRNALEYSDPKVVVIDCYYLSSEEKTDSKAEFLHLSLDAFPISATKIQTVFDLFDTTEDRTAFLIPFTTYHNRWKELTVADFTPIQSVEKGGGIRIGFKQLAQQEYLAPDDMCADTTTGVSYLREMIEYCQERNIEVLLAYIPYETADWGQRESNRAVALAEEYGIHCLDLRTLDQQINYTTDFSDSGHMNYSGGAKITRYIGNYIAQNFDVADRRSELAYEEWFDDQTEYAAYKESLMVQQTSAAMFLPMLADYDLATIMFVNGQWNYNAADAMLQDWGVATQTLDSDQTFLLFNDRACGVCKTIFIGQSLETQYGILSLVEENGGYSVYINGEHAYAMEYGRDAGMWCRVLMADTGETVYQTEFNKKGYH